MASNIDVTVPIEGSPTTESVRNNFQVIKNEIEALQASTPDVIEISVMNFMTQAQIDDVRAGTLLLNVATEIQAAIDYAATVSTVVNATSTTTVVFPDGMYRCESLITVPGNINIICQGTLFNARALATDFIISMASASRCDRLAINANGKSGAIIGQAATSNNILIGNIVVRSSIIVANTVGIRFLGNDIIFNNIYSYQMSMAVDFGDGGPTQARHIVGDSIVAYRGATAVRFFNVAHVDVSKIICNSQTSMGVQIDKATTLKAAITAFFDDTVGGACFASGYAVDIGLNSAAAADQNQGCDLWIAVNNTGGNTVRVNNTNYSRMKAYANSHPLPTGNTHPITAGVTSSATNTNGNTFECFTDGLVVGFDPLGTVPSGTMYQTVSDGYVYYDKSLFTSSYRFKFSNGELIGCDSSYLPFDESIVSNTVLGNVTNMLAASSVGGNGHIRRAEFEMVLGNALATTGFKVGCSFGAAVTDVQDFVVEVIPDNVSAANKLMKRTGILAGVTSASLDFTAANLAGIASARVRVITVFKQAAGGGYCQMQLAQSTSSATALTTFAGAAAQGKIIALS